MTYSRSVVPTDLFDVIRDDPAPETWRYSIFYRRDGKIVRQHFATIEALLLAWQHVQQVADLRGLCPVESLYPGKSRARQILGAVQLRHSGLSGNVVGEVTALEIWTGYAELTKVAASDV